MVGWMDSVRIYFIWQSSTVDKRRIVKFCLDEPDSGLETRTPPCLSSQSPLVVGLHLIDLSVEHLTSESNEHHLSRRHHINPSPGTHP